MLRSLATTLRLVHNALRNVRVRLRFLRQSRRSRRRADTFGPRLHALIVNTDIGRFAVDPSDLVVGEHLLMHGTYGEAERARIAARLTPSSALLVIGAHIGTMAIPLAHLARRVVAIEANPRTFDLLATNLSLNNIRNCEALQLAASDRAELLGFLVSRANSGGSKRIPRAKQYIYYYDQPEEVRVTARALDTVFPDEHFDVVVMDIEGSEYFALHGMQRILSTARLLAVEFLPHHLRHVSGVSVEEFLSVVAPHFTMLTIPSRNITVPRDGFLPALTAMYDADVGDEGILFEK